MSNLKLNPKELECRICFNAKKKCNLWDDIEFISLTCDHEFCKKCFCLYLNDKLLESSFSKPADISCPIENCSKPINYFIIFDALPKAIEIYENKTKDSFVTKQNSNFFKKQESECCIPNSNENYNYCTKDLPCEDMDKNLDSFEAFLQKKNWKRCPVCQIPIEKISGGCNVINCLSNKCQNKTIFCYLCGEKLNEQIKYSHFFENNNFNGCKGLKK